MSWKKGAAVCGMAAGPISFGAMYIFGALRPGYSHAVNAVSELGVVGSPNALAWNLIGFVIPGLMLALAGAGIAADVTGRTRSSLTFWLLVVAGLGFAGTGLFAAEMADGELVVTPSTQGHLIASLVHGLGWLVAAVIMFPSLGRNPAWKGMRWPHVALIALVLLCVIGLRGTFSNAIVQRLAGAANFLWYFVMARRLYRVAGSSASAT